MYSVSRDPRVSVNLPPRLVIAVVNEVWNQKLINNFSCCFEEKNITAKITITVISADRKGYFLARPVYDTGQLL